MASYKFTNLSIRTQLIALAVLLTLPAFGLVVYSGLKERANDYQHAVIESQRLADSLAAQQEILANEAKLLCTRKGTPVLHIHRTTCDHEGKPFELVESFYRGDRYTFYAELRGDGL